MGAELNPRNLVLGAGGPPPPRGALGAGATLVGTGAAAGAGAGEAPPRPLVKATCGSVFGCVVKCGCLYIGLCRIKEGHFGMSMQMTQMVAVLIEAHLTGHGDDHGGDDEKGWWDEAEVFHFVGKVVVGVGLEEEGGSVPGG